MNLQTSQMASFFLFVIGSAVGSFLNVVSLRYLPGRFLFSSAVVGGRSRCTSCGNQLKWFELLPILSFLFIGGKCRYCGIRLKIQYPLVEILSGLIFLFVPLRLANILVLGRRTLILYSSIWIFALVLLLLLALIDLRLFIIPDELNIFLFVLGIVYVFLVNVPANVFSGSVLGGYGLMLGAGRNIWLSHLLGASFGGVFFGLIIFLTRGRGMGMGDLKLILPLGFLFGWPEILPIIAISFIAGSLAGIVAMIWKKKNLKSAVPFAPFLVLASAIVFFFGKEVLDLYFGISRLFLVS